MGWSFVFIKNKKINRVKTSNQSNKLKEERDKNNIFLEFNFSILSRYLKANIININNM